MDDNLLFQKIKDRDRDAFNTLFKLYYTSLCRFAYSMTLSEEDAEESVQEMFVAFWQKAPSLDIEISLKSYLYRATRNQVLNAIKKKQVEMQYSSTYYDELDLSENSQILSDEEINKIIKLGVEKLPEACRQIFILAKYEGLSYEEIAEYLNISKKTIENQMGIALKKLREYLNPIMKKLLVLLFILSIFRGITF